MPVANRYYGGTSIGGGGTIQDFGLCDIKGNYTHTTRIRPKGMMLVTFFSPNSTASGSVLDIIQAWTSEIPTDKWTGVAVSEGERDDLNAYAESHALSNITVLVDYDLYQTRNWGISHLPSTFLIAGKTGRILKRITGGDPVEMTALKQMLQAEIDSIVVAEAAVKKAADAAAAKLAELAKK